MSTSNCNHGDMCGRWRRGFILFLIFLVPMTPILAHVQEGEVVAILSTHRSEATQSGSSKAASQFSQISIADDIGLRLAENEHVVRVVVGGLTYSGGMASALLTEKLHGGLGHSLFVSVPPPTDACTAGKLDAEKEVSATGHFILGLLTGPWGVLAAYLIPPSIPDEKIMGRSGKSLISYMECYKDEGKGIHAKWAWIGFGSAMVVWLIVVMIIWAGQKPSN